MIKLNKFEESTDDKHPLTELTRIKKSSCFSNEHSIDSESQNNGFNEAQKLLTRKQIILLNLSFLGINVMFLLLSVEIVPAQIQALVGSSWKGEVLGAVAGVGAVVTFITGPLIGMFSDRLSTKYGRRRPIMVIACTVLSLALLGMSFTAPNINGQKSNSTNNSCDVNLEYRRCNPFFLNKTDLLNFLNLKLVDLNWNTDLNSKSVYAPEYSSKNLAFFIPLYLIVIIAYVCTLTPYNGLIADKVHPMQRGFSSGVMGGMILLGNIGGAVLGLLLEPIGVLWVNVIALIILGSCIALTVIYISEDNIVIKPKSLTCRDTLFGFWAPLKDHDYRWVFITRFLVQLGVTTTIGFLEYWLNDMVPLPNCWNAFTGVSLILIPMLVTAAISSVMCGTLSDKLNKRKLFVIIASMIMAITSFSMIFLRGQFAFYFTIMLAVFYGLAFGGYQAVDFALLMDVLPNSKEKSRDIAVWQQALVLPQAIAVPIGGVIVDYFEHLDCRLGLGYIILFAITTVYFILSGVFVRKIRRSS